MKPRSQAFTLVLIGAIDLCSTLYFVTQHGASEANPLMAPALERGIPVFIQAKLLLLVGPLAFLEWARRRRPAFVSWAMNACILLYIGMYSVGVARINRPPELREVDLRITQEEVDAQRREMGLPPRGRLPYLRHEG